MARQEWVLLCVWIPQCSLHDSDRDSWGDNDHWHVHETVLGGEFLLLEGYQRMIY
jgi:hypothetical protein